jgi:hypothetical protein
MFSHIPAEVPRQVPLHGARPPCAGRAAMRPVAHPSAQGCQWRKLPPARRKGFLHIRPHPGSRLFARRKSGTPHPALCRKRKIAWPAFPRHTSRDDLLLQPRDCSKGPAPAGRKLRRVRPSRTGFSLSVFVAARSIGCARQTRQAEACPTGTPRDTLLPGAQGRAVDFSRFRAAK